ncbi:MAG TPA: hypothetical protein VEH04_05285 [Verrucomicrobiae bacterium]|nr:hypothetical protein [Verrucomicrobiae bacterium]
MNHSPAIVALLVSAVFAQAAVIEVPDPDPTPGPYHITLQIAPADGGRISGGGIVPWGARVDLNAAPNPGFVFSNWTENGEVFSTAKSLNLFIDRDLNLTANFIKPEQTSPLGWDSRFMPPPGLNGAVLALATRGNDLFAGGEFTSAEGTNAAYLARWDGKKWHAVGAGLNGPVYALLVRGGNLIVGGSFTQAGNTAATNIARWNGRAWAAIGSGLSGAPNSIIGASAVLALAVDGNKLYAAGGFDHAGEVAAANIAVWNGRKWSALATGITDGFGNPNNAAVYTLARRGPELYAGGRFDRAGTASAQNIARWKRGQWDRLENGLRAPTFGFPQNTKPAAVYSLVTIDNRVFAAGYFTRAGGSNVAPQNPPFPPLPPFPVTEPPSARGPFHSDFNGHFSDWLPPFVIDTSEVGFVDVRNSAIWTGKVWVEGPSFDNTVYRLSRFGTNLYAAGEFNHVNQRPASRIAYAGLPPTSRYSASSTNNLVLWLLSRLTGRAAQPGSPAWNSIDVQSEAIVFDIAVFRRQMHAGGTFESIAAIPAGNVASWNGASWSPLGSAVPNGLAGDPQSAIVGASPAGAYVVGNLQRAGTLGISNAVHWTGQEWRSLGNGMVVNSPIQAAVVNGDLFVSGQIQIPGMQVPWNGGWSDIGRWDGQQWLSIGSGSFAGPPASVLASDETTLYVLLRSSFIAQVSDIVKWNGLQWSTVPLVPTPPNVIISGYSCAAANGDELYIALGTTIFRWNGTAWTTLPGSFSRSGTMPFPFGTPPSISAMIVHEGALIVAGDFTAVNGVAMTNLARWDGLQWSSPGSAFASQTDRVTSLARAGGRLYVGGTFTSIGGIPARHVAKWQNGTWEPLGSGLWNSQGVTHVSLAASGNRLYAVGDFTSAGDQAAHHFAVWTEE